MTYLPEVEAGIAKLRDRPALIVCVGEQDGGFREPERVRLQVFIAHCEVQLLLDAKHFIQENAQVAICAASRDRLLR